MDDAKRRAQLSKSLAVALRDPEFRSTLPTPPGVDLVVLNALEHDELRHVFAQAARYPHAVYVAVHFDAGKTMVIHIECGGDDERDVSSIAPGAEIGLLAEYAKAVRKPIVCRQVDPGKSVESIGDACLTHA